MALVACGDGGTSARVPAQLARPPGGGRAATTAPPSAPAPAVTVGVGAARGQLTARLPLPALPTRAGFGPELAVVHDGTTVDLGSGFGAGFALSVPAITLSREYGLTLPRSSGADPLVTPLSYQGSRLQFVRALDGADPKVVEYRPEVAETLTRIYYHRAPTTVKVIGGTLSFQGVLVVQADGRKELYSEEPAVAEQDVFESANGRKAYVTVRFPLRYQIAPSGDVIEYRYEKDPVDDRSYLRAVIFAGGRARYDFTLAERPAAPDRPVYDLGFLQRQTHLYTAVRGSFDDQVVSRTYFVYRESDGAQASLFAAPEVAGVAADAFARTVASAPPLSEESLLVGVLRYGDGTSAIGPTTARLAPLAFSYVERSWADLRAQTTVQTLDMRGVAGFGAGEGGEFLDVDQDGLIDVVYTDRDATSSVVYLNQGEAGAASFQRSTRPLTVTGPRGAVVPDFFGGGRSVWLPGDFDGDGVDDLLEIARAASEAGGSLLTVYPGQLGSGDFFAPARGSFPSKRALESFADGAAQVVDVNGDSRDDLLIAERRDGVVRLSLLLNRTRSAGLSDGGKPSFLELDARFEAPPLFHQTALGVDPNLGAAENRLTDVNGDGLVDLTVVRVTEAGDKGVCVFENRGAVRTNVDSPSGAVAKDIPLFGDRTRSSAACPGGYFVAIPELASVSTVNALWQIDLTGDGLTDLVNVGDRPDRLKIWIGRGRERFRYAGEFTIDAALRVDASNRWNTRVLDLDGDGQEEIAIFVGGERPVLQLVDFNRREGEHLAAPGLLTEVREGRGIRQLVQYTTTTDELLRDRAHGRPDARGAPFVTPLVKRLIVQQPHRPSAVSEYRYHGATVDAVERGLLGFRAVEEVAYGDQHADGSVAQITYELTGERFRDRVLGARERSRVVSTLVADAATAAQLTAFDAASWASAPSLAFVSEASAVRREPALGIGARLARRDTRWDTDVPPSGARPALFVRVSEVQTATFAADCHADGCPASSSSVRYDHDGCNRPTQLLAHDAAVMGTAGVDLPPRTERTTIAYAVACDAASAQPSVALPLTAQAQVTRRSGSGRVLRDVAYAYAPERPFVPSRVTTTASADLGAVPGRLAGAVVQVPPRTETFAYDDYLNVVGYGDQTGAIAGVTFDAQGVRVVATSNGLGHTQQFSYAPGALGPVGVTTPRGAVVKVGYDTLQRLASMEQPDGRKTSFAYREVDVSDTRQVLVRETRSESETNATLYVAHADGRAFAEIEPAEAGGARVRMQVGYGRRGWRGKSRLPFLIARDPAAVFAGPGEGWLPADALSCGGGRVACARQDALGRQVAFADASTRYQEVTRHEPWGTHTEVRDESGPRAASTLQRGDRIFAIVDEHAGVHRFERDDAEELRAVRLAGEAEARSVVTDSLGRVLYSAIPFGMSKVFQRDARGRVIRESIFDRALEAGGQVDTRWDVLDRPIARETRGPGDAAERFDAVTWTYDHQEGGSEGDVGSLVRATSQDHLAGASFEETFRYDRDGRVVARRAAFRRGALVRSYGESWHYAFDGLLTAYVDPFENRFDYTLTASGRVREIAWRGHTAAGVLTRATAFDAFGQVATSIRPAQQVVETLRHDPASGLLTGRQVCKEGAQTCLQDDTWTRRGDGRVTALQGLAGSAATYAYTPRGELQRVELDGAALAYEADAAGHWQRVGELAAATFGRVEQPLALPPDHATDAFGRLTRAGANRTLRYDPAGRLRRVEMADKTILYTYGPSGQRVARTTSGAAEPIVYPTEQTRDDGVQRQSLVRHDDVPLALIVDEQTPYGLLTDQRGVVEGLISPEGARLGAFRHAPFGALREASAPADLASLELLRSFTGSLRDDDTDLVRMGARDYLPAIAAFTTPDPLFQEHPELCSARPLECMPYGYVARDPLNYIDPSGTTRSGSGHRRRSRQRSASQKRRDQQREESQDPGGPSAPGPSRATADIADDAIVCRGGTCKAQQFAEGSGVTIDDNGGLQGVSVNVGTSVDQVTEGIRNGQVGLTTAAAIRALGGEVVASPTRNNPLHATLSGLTADQAAALFETVPNPNKVRK